MSFQRVFEVNHIPHFRTYLPHHRAMIMAFTVQNHINRDTDGNTCVPNVSLDTACIRAIEKALLMEIG